MRTLSIALLALILSGCTFIAGPVFIAVDWPPVASSTPLPWPTPTPEIAPTATPINTLRCTVATRAGLNVRSGADISYPVIAGPLAYGVEIVPIGGAGNWIRIASPPGWVADWLVWCE